MNTIEHEAAFKEFAEKYKYGFVINHGGVDIDDETDCFIDDLTALISHRFVPKEDHDLILAENRQLKEDNDILLSRNTCSHDNWDWIFEDGVRKRKWCYDCKRYISEVKR